MHILFVALTACESAAPNEQEESTSDVTDLFDVDGTTASDVVFFGETSGTMQPQVATLGMNILRFLGALDSRGNDWQLASVNGPDGCVVNGIITPDTPSYADVFADAIRTKPLPGVVNNYGGEDARVDEWGLYNLTSAAEHALQGCNVGLLRQGAMFHGIIVSDHADLSPGSDEPGYWQQYVDRLLATKAGALRGPAKISAIVGPVPDGCVNDQTEAEPGDGYDKAVAATRGEMISICDDWVSELEALADASIADDTFALSGTPIPDTIEVSIEDERMGSGWTYYAIGNQVELDEPPRGSRVEISYELASPE